MWQTRWVGGKWKLSKLSFILSFFLVEAERTKKRSQQITNHMANSLSNILLKGFAASSLTRPVRSKTIASSSLLISEQFPYFIRFLQLFIVFCFLLFTLVIAFCFLVFSLLSWILHPSLFDYWIKLEFVRRNLRINHWRWHPVTAIRTGELLCLLLIWICCDDVLAFHIVWNLKDCFYCDVT